MKDEDKPREQLISEITELRQQLGETKSSLEELKKSEAKYHMPAEATRKATYKNLTGQLAGLVGVFIDITERKQIEEMLRQTASELQAVFQALPDLYFRLTMEPVST